MSRLDLHRLGEERSIAMHRAIADRLESEPAILLSARARVEDWLATGDVHREYAEAWRVVLEGTLAQVVAFLVNPGEDARALRQVTPFAGALDARTRWRIREEVARSFG
jgi:hypothetical protein